MRPVHWIAQAALVVVGLFVYDLVRDAAPGSARPAATVIERGAAEEALPPATSPRAPWEEQIRDLHARLEALEAAGREDPHTASIAPLPPLPPHPAREDEVAAPVPWDLAFSPEEIARFRALAQAAAGQGRAEQVREHLIRALGDGHVALPQDVQRDLIEDSLRAWRRAEEVRRRLEEEQATPEVRRAACEALRADYEIAIARIVPRQDVDALIERLVPEIGLEPVRFLDADADGR